MAEPFTPKPGYSFPAGPDAATLAYLKAKGWAPAWSYKDVWGDEHAFAFTVAKATKLEVLQAIRQELETAMAQGLPFEAFQKRLTPRLIELGWWGEGAATDPKSIDPATGTPLERPGMLGSPRRLKIIYRANVRTSHAAGQWARIEATKHVLPYLVYEVGASERHRPEHLAKAGLMLPVDDSFWRTWMPPNGWGCKCRVRQVSKVEAARRGWKVGTAPDVPTRPWRNDRTGEIIPVPKGVDPGWDSNPGLARRENLDRLAGDKLRQASADLARAAIADQVASLRFAQWLDKPEGAFPVARLPDEVAAKIGAKNPVAQLSAETMAKQKGELPGNPGHPELSVAEYRKLPFLSVDPELVVKDGGRTLVVIRRDGELFIAAIKATKTGEATFVTSFRRTNEKDLREKRAKGEILYQRREGN